MAKRQGVFVMNNFKHGFVWWLCIGWWWRPIKYILGYSFASLFGFKNIKVNKHR